MILSGGGTVRGGKPTPTMHHEERRSVRNLAQPTRYVGQRAVAYAVRSAGAVDRYRNRRRLGRVMARGRTGGRPVGTMDAFIAATAERHHLTLVTRNVSDFDVLGIRLINPWSNG